MITRINVVNDIFYICSKCGNEKKTDYFDFTHCIDDFNKELTCYECRCRKIDFDDYNKSFLLEKFENYKSKKQKIYADSIRHLAHRFFPVYVENLKVNNPDWWFMWQRTIRHNVTHKFINEIYKELYSNSTLFDTLLGHVKKDKQEIIKKQKNDLIKIKWDFQES